MLAYRHAFHAGNHADVLKHITLCLVLRYMNLKDKPYRLIDTHAGAGGYSLASPEAQKKGEFEHGILRLWDRQDLPPAVVAQACDIIVDAVGCALSAWVEDPEKSRIADCFLRTLYFVLATCLNRAARFPPCRSRP